MEERYLKITLWIEAELTFRPRVYSNDLLGEGLGFSPLAAGEMNEGGAYKLLSPCPFSTLH